MGQGRDDMRKNSKKMIYSWRNFWMGQGRDDMRKNSKRMVYGWKNFLVFTVLHERNYHV